MFSMLVFMCRDPGDTTSKVSCVEPYSVLKVAIVKVPHALPLKMSLTRKHTVILKKKKKKKAPLLL